jgi:hypothetical protein
MYRHILKLLVLYKAYNAKPPTAIYLGYEEMNKLKADPMYIEENWKGFAEKRPNISGIPVYTVDVETHLNLA